MRCDQVLAIAALAIALPRAVPAQDGKLVEQRTFTADDSLVRRLRQASGTPQAAVDRVEMREVTYLSDGLKVKGFIVTPRGSGRLPVMIFNRGGCKNFGTIPRAAVAEWLAPFADWGYVVVASQYRGNGGSEGKDEFGGSDVNDVLNLLPLIDSLPRADPTRIGIWSESRGGMMTYLVLARTDRIRAAVISSTPTDSRRSLHTGRRCDRTMTSRNSACATPSPTTTATRNGSWPRGRPSDGPIG